MIPFTNSCSTLIWDLLNVMNINVMLYIDSTEKGIKPVFFLCQYSTPPKLTSIMNVILEILYLPLATYVILHRMLSLLISLFPSGGLTNVWQIIAIFILARTQRLFSCKKKKHCKPQTKSASSYLSMNIFSSWSLSHSRSCVSESLHSSTYMGVTWKWVKQKIRGG